MPERPTSRKRNAISVPEEVKARARESRERLKHKPGAGLLTAQERADAAPFYFELRAFVKQLRDAREAAGLTLAQVAERTGMAAESLSRLETGAATNPTWKTLCVYAAAVGLRPRLTVELLPEVTTGESEQGPGRHREKRTGER